MSDEQTTPEFLTNGDALVIDQQRQAGGTDRWGPELAVPVAEQRRRMRQADRRNDTPSWLMSLVTHMTLLVIVGALASTPQVQGRMNPIVITLSVMDGEDDTNSNVVASMLVQDQLQTGDGQDDAKEHEDPTLDATKTITKPVRHETERAPSAIKRFTKTLEPNLRLDLTVMNEHMLREAQDGSQHHGTTRSVNNDHALTRTEMDHVVERFIRFDIGQLPGPAGARAVRDLQRLGPEAIPALVRGLNKAAAMRASCPIGVISHRLNALLQRTKDPSLIAYALDNIGRNVSEKDPHFRSIQSLTKRWKKMFGTRYARTTPRKKRKWWMPNEWQQERPSLSVDYNRPAGQVVMGHKLGIPTGSNNDSRLANGRSSGNAPEALLGPNSWREAEGNLGKTISGYPGPGDAIGPYRSTMRTGRPTQDIWTDRTQQGR